MKPASPHLYDSVLRLAALAVVHLIQALLGFSQAALHYYRLKTLGAEGIAAEPKTFAEIMARRDAKAAASEAAAHRVDEATPSVPQTECVPDDELEVTAEDHERARAVALRHGLLVKERKR